MHAEVRTVVRRLRQCADLAFVADVLYSGIVRLRLRRCGAGLRLRTSDVISGHGNIVIGKNFASSGHLHLSANDGGYVEIGDDCDVNNNVLIGGGSGRIIMGNHVSIAPNVVLRAANHGMARGIPMKHQASTPGEIRIEDDVWIGSNAVVTADVVLARGTVVGAGAVVTHSTEPYSIVAGVPARKIRERP
jgi:acetyltransferase-like isoleucine patch superfamily enzyme